MTDLDLDDLRSELDEFAQPEKKGGRSAREERIIAGFEEIQRFVEKNGHIPQHGEDKDIFERLYAVRLDRLRLLDECRVILVPLDHQNLLAGSASNAESLVHEIDEDELLAELRGVEDTGDITQLRHVRTYAEKQAAEEIANSTICEDFEKFAPVFDQVKIDLQDGVRQTRRFGKEASIAKGDLFILGGQTVYVAEVGEEIKAPNGAYDARLRVIYGNGTESDLLLRSLQRALYKDQTGLRITSPVAGPLFADSVEEEDIASGTIYVVRSKSDDPSIAAYGNKLHKIGVTGGSVKARIANAAVDPTYLLAEVEVVATYKLYNINRVRLEKIFHRVFSAARLDLSIPDRLGRSIQPQEWFVVPLPVIDDVISKIMDGSITDFRYDPETESLVSGS